MAHAAKVNPETKIVEDVVVVPDNQEGRVNDFLSTDLGLGGWWVQTSYNANIRKNFAGIGMSYSEELDAFIPIKPFESWVLNEDNCQWEAPIPYPTDGIMYRWNEENADWEATVND